MRNLLVPALLLIALQSSAQTLFTIGKDSVSAAEFLTAFQKNNSGPETEQAKKEYLQLFIAAKLKVKEARSRGLDTTAQFRTDLEALRAQVLPAYLSDPQSLQQLADEAFTRAQQELQVAHIFIAASGADTTAAHTKAMAAYKRLQSGEAFESVARAFSEDPSVQANGGNLGYITVFSLPYALENLAYATPVGQLTPLYRSKAGYHILKNVAARKAQGRMRAAQILLAYPPEATAADKQKLQKTADSIYTALQKGASFEALAERFSNDALSAGAGGALPEFGAGEYDPVFEGQAFSLAKDGAITRPFTTTHGIHIVKRLQLLAIPATADEAFSEQLRTRIQQSDRMEGARRQQAARVLALAGYRPLPDALLAALQTRTQQEQEGSVPAQAMSGSAELFRLGDQPFTLEQWLAYYPANRLAADGATVLPFEQIWQNFVEEQALEHYRRYLERYNPAFRAQMQELEEGNLFFEIMQQEIWTPAQNDTAALRHYYEQHRERYRWNQSADAVLFYALNKEVAQKLAAQVSKAPARWRTFAEQLGGDVTTDSLRMEWRTIPGSGKVSFAKGQTTPPEINPADGSATFAYIIRVYDQPLQRSFEEARGNVINDYQAQKEKEWVESLKRKYKTTILTP